MPSVDACNSNQASKDNHMHDQPRTPNPTNASPSRRRRMTAWCRKAAWLIPAAMVIYGGVILAQPPSVDDLSKKKKAVTVTELMSAWEDGEVIVLLRHLERCDRVDAPCLDGEEGGITARAVPDGDALGTRFEQLGLNKAEISNSPLTRTAQTAQVVFKRAEQGQSWLYDCDEEMLGSVTQRKAPGRNLVLVTHSGCMQALQLELGYDDDTPDYGTALFVSARSDGAAPELLGFLDIEDWDAALGH